jgi:hypothetical protein
VKRGLPMRKLHRTQLLALLQTIYQAQNAGEYAACQEGALSICDFIDREAGEGTRTVALLESYCELLFRVHNKEVSPKALHKHYLEVEKCAKSELQTNRIEVAFISYKAAMSDSLESIYLAAKADPACDAYWIPVPYYDKNPDGSLGQMHYEGADCYESHFEITDWQTYDMETRRPDAIYTFNPYDDINYVTAIHPHFFCERLITYTDMLVYVPYFVVDAGGANVIIGSHWDSCGVMYATKTIVQSEAVKKGIIYGLRKEERRLDKKGLYGNLEKKLLPLGSPKFDKIINTTKEQAAIPPEWGPIIAGKKVVFYNTSVGSIAEHGRVYLSKLRDVLNFFKNHRSVALLWRPHPLSINTYQSIHPSLKNEYEHIVAQYKREGWGVYDDSPHLHRAIAWSDAYYGDISSVMLLFSSASKPVLVSEKIFRKDNDYISPRAMYIDEKHIWILPKGINALCKVNRFDLSVSYAGSFPEEESISPLHYFSFYDNPVISNGKLYFPPLMAKEISLYSPKDGLFNKITYDNLLGTYDGNGAFMGVVSYCEYIFFTPCRYPAILRLNTVTKEINYYTEWMDSLNTNESNDTMFLYPLVVENIFYLAARWDNVVLAFDMETGKSTVYKIGNGNYRFRGAMCFDGKNIWLTPVKGSTPVICWHPNEGVVKEYPEFYNYIEAGTADFECFFNNNYVWFVPFEKANVIKIDVNTGEISIAKEALNIGVYTKLSFIHYYEDIVYTYDEENGILLQFNCITNELHRGSLHYAPELKEKLKELIVGVFSKGDTIYMENVIARLSDFVTHVTSNSPENINIDNNGTTGLNIYQTIKTLI